MASINGREQLALLMEQYPDAPVVFETEQDVDAGYPQVICAADMDSAMRYNGQWFFDAEDFADLIAAEMYDRDGEYPDPDWYDEYFRRHAEDVIHVILCDEEVDD